MSKKKTQNIKKLTYHQPKVYILGSLEQVQSGSQGNQNDGASQYSYFYA